MRYCRDEGRRAFGASLLRRALVCQQCGCELDLDRIRQPVGSPMVAHKASVVLDATQEGAGFIFIGDWTDKPPRGAPALVTWVIPIPPLRILHK
jgi:hypothetical protein